MENVKQTVHLMPGDVDLVGWSGITWNGHSRRAWWSDDMLWEGMHEGAGPSLRPSEVRVQLGVKRILRLCYGVTLVGFGLGDTLEEARDRLHTYDGERLTFDEACLRWGDRLPDAAQVAELRERYHVDGFWPAHEKGTHCQACGAKHPKTPRKGFA